MMIEKDVNWQDIDSLVENIHEEIVDSGKKYDWIVGINRGGLIPSVLLSHKLGIRHGVISVSHYDGNIALKEVKKDLYISMIGLFKSYHKVLVVDDIADSGVCLVETEKSIVRIDPDVKNLDMATLHYKPKSIVKPRFIGEEVDNDTWINYPWETKVKNELQRKAVANM